MLKIDPYSPIVSGVTQERGVIIDRISENRSIFISFKIIKVGFEESKNDVPTIVRINCKITSSQKNFGCRT